VVDADAVQLHQLAGMLRLGMTHRRGEPAAAARAGPGSPRSDPGGWLACWAGVAQHAPDPVRADPGAAPAVASQLRGQALESPAGTVQGHRQDVLLRHGGVLLDIWDARRTRGRKASRPQRSTGWRHRDLPGDRRSGTLKSGPPSRW
jgi:hypothetical protein